MNILRARSCNFSFDSLRALFPQDVTFDNHFIANASAGAQATVVPIDIYKPLWLRESEAQMLAESRKRYSQPVQQIEAMTAEQAKAYLTAAGDKDSAREAARKDGLEFQLPDLFDERFKQIFNYEK